MRPLQPSFRAAHLTLTARLEAGALPHLPLPLRSDVVGPRGHRLQGVTRGQDVVGIGRRRGGQQLQGRTQ